MTAEIALINSSGVVLSADSAVTVGRARTYTHANKIFELSKTQPIGIMIYGNADFGQLPMETIIKAFRYQVANKRVFKTIEECHLAFIRFLNGAKQKRYLLEVNERNLGNRAILEAIINILIGPDILFDTSSEVSRKSILQLFENFFTRLKSDMGGRDRDLSFKEPLAQFRKKINEDDIEKNIIETFRILVFNQFGRLPTELFASRTDTIAKILVMKSVQNKIIEILHFLLSKNWQSNQATGYFICGYGVDEFFPSFHHGILDGTYLKRLRNWQIDEQDGGGPSTILMPMAQRDVTEAFMEGIEKTWIQELSKAANDMITKVFQVTDPKQQISDEIMDKVYEDLSRLWGEKISNLQNDYSEPIMRSLKTLPKEEMALLAEALVELTSVKRRFDSPLQTVGGPIDVAIITKGDGFIWSKRKHYFKPDLNPSWYNKQELDRR